MMERLRSIWISTSKYKGYMNKHKMTLMYKIYLLVE
jgi:hypothetical protein